jgi:hypothetical protein
MDSERLFNQITELNKIKKLENPKYHPLQIWCADMWAVLWNGWKMGKKTITHKNLSFSWATSAVDEIEKMNIMHNAGVTNDKGNLFYKANYINKLPYFDNLEIKENSASKYYWDWIQKTAKKTILI